MKVASATVSMRACAKAILRWLITTRNSRSRGRLWPLMMFFGVTSATDRHTREKQSAGLIMVPAAGAVAPATGWGKVGGEGVAKAHTKMTAAGVDQGWKAGGGEEHGDRRGQYRSHAPHPTEMSLPSYILLGSHEPREPQQPARHPSHIVTCTSRRTCANDRRALHPAATTETATGTATATAPAAVPSHTMPAKAPETTQHGTVEARTGKNGCQGRNGEKGGKTHPSA